MVLDQRAESCLVCGLCDMEILKSAVHLIELFSFEGSFF